MNIELLETIERTGSKLEKEELLKRADGELRLFIEQCLDPDITYGATVEESDFVDGLKSVKTPNGFWKDMKDLLDRLAKRELTGNAAASRIKMVLFCAPDSVHHKWAIRFINKQLRAGFDISTYNKAFGAGTVEKFGVQLADVYEAQILEGEWLFQPKLDGNRVIFLDEEAKSRNGKTYPNCDHVIDEIKKHYSDFFSSYVADGEMMGDLGFDKSSGALRRINEKNREKATFTYWIFDLVRKGEWISRNTRSLRDRMKDLEKMFDGKGFISIKIVPYKIIKNPTHKQVMDLCDEYVAAGFEGAMAKRLDASYKFKRGDNLLKVKKFFDVDLNVIDFYEGKGKHKGRLGGIIVEGEGVQCKVGSGFDDALRDEIWKNRKGWLGAKVQIQYQDKTKDGSLRFPVFVMRRKDKE